MSKINQLKENNPKALLNDDIRALAEQADQLHDIKALFDTIGGKALFKLVTQDAVARVYALEANYKTASHAELLALCADLSSHLQLARLLRRAEENERLADEALTEALTA